MVGKIRQQTDFPEVLKRQRAAMVGKTRRQTVFPGCWSGNGRQAPTANGLANRCYKRPEPVG